MGIEKVKDKCPCGSGKNIKHAAESKKI